MKDESPYFLLYEDGTVTREFIEGKKAIAFLFEGYFVLFSQYHRRMNFKQAQKVAGESFIHGLNCTLMPVVTLEKLMAEYEKINDALAPLGVRLQYCYWGLQMPSQPSEASGEVRYPCVEWSSSGVEVRQYPSQGTAYVLCCVREEAHDEL